MINVNFLNINNSLLIGRLLPFWLRGRTISLLLQSLIYPLRYPHKAFMAWALELYIEHHITAQKLSIEWFLKYKLQKHFRNPEDEFDIIQTKENNDPSEKFIIVIKSPQIVDTIDYDHEAYERDIRYILSKFMISFNRIKVSVNDIQ